MKINHAAHSWQEKGRMVLNPKKKYDQPSEDQVRRGKARQRAEDMNDYKDEQAAIKEIWE